MAILKIISHGKNNKAKRQLLQYILNPEKTEESLCHVCGDYQKGSITPQNVYKEFQRIRILFGKDGGTNRRTYTHGTISFAKGEVTPEEAKVFVCEFIERVYPNHQVLVAVHTDTKHRHAHFMIEPVSYLNGDMLHTSKQDLERAKKICNLMCEERSLSVPQKGTHFDGSQFSSGEITIWDKNRYQMIMKHPEKSYLIDLLIAIERTVESTNNKEEFCKFMENEYGWSVIWKETKKNITFVDNMGHRVRDSNLKKTFNININKEILESHFCNKADNKQMSRNVSSKRAGKRR